MKKSIVRKFRSVLRQFDRELFFQNNSACCDGVSMAQCHALLEIEEKRDITVTEVSDLLMLNKSTVSRTVDGLVNIGLVDREIPKENRRTTVLRLTKNGARVCNNIHWNNDKYVDKTLSVLSKDEQETLINLLDKVTNQMAVLRNNPENIENCC